MNSDGKGRFKIKSGGHLFRYESILNTGENSWDMAFEIPLYGEKLMSLSWNDLGMVKIRGPFYGQVFDMMSHKKKTFKNHRGLLKRFLKFLSFIARLKSEQLENKNFTTQCQGDDCLALNESFIWYQNDSELTLKQKINDRISLVLRGVSSSNGYYQKLSFLVDNIKNDQQKGNSMELNLFPSSCSDLK